MQQTERDFARIKETLEVLRGERGAERRPQSAIRRGELLPLAGATLQSAQVTAAPTMAEYNALQADVKMIFAALALISNRLGNATLPTG